MTTHLWPGEVRLADPWRWQSPALRSDWTPSPYLSPCRCSPSNAHYHLLWDWEGNQPLFLLQLSTGCEILSSNDALFAFKLLITIKTIDFGDQHFIISWTFYEWTFHRFFFPPGPAGPLAFSVFIPDARIISISSNLVIWLRWWCNAVDCD